MRKFLFLVLIIFITSSFVNAEPVNVSFDDGIYHIVMDGNKVKKQIKFVSSSELITNKDAHLKQNALLTVNAGFFDPKNQKTISYVVTDSIVSEDPMFNEGIMKNPVLRQNLSKILNRTEFRVMDCDGKVKYEIAQHNSKVDFLCSITQSAQGGPQLLPNLRLEEEFFVVKDKDGNVVRESASVLHKTARTLIGLKTLEKGAQEIHIFIVTNAHPMDIYESRDLCARYGLDSAMAFDGGSSTSLDYKNIHVVSTQESGDTGRALKSFLVIRKK